jgi:hypothetical protein
MKTIQVPPTQSAETHGDSSPASTFNIHAGGNVIVGDIGNVIEPKAEKLRNELLDFLSEKERTINDLLDREWIQSRSSGGAWDELENIKQEIDNGLRNTFNREDLASRFTLDSPAALPEVVEYTPTLSNTEFIKDLVNRRYRLKEMIEILSR